MIKLTEELLNKGLSDKNGFSKKQIRMLGEDMSKHGWRNRLLKKLVSQNDYDKFLGIKNQHLNKNLKKQSEINTLIGYENFKSEQDVKRCIREEFRYGREGNVSRLLFKILKESKYLKDQNKILTEKNENCYCQQENMIDENYQMFMDKTID